ESSGVLSGRRREAARPVRPYRTAAPYCGTVLRHRAEVRRTESGHPRSRSSGSLRDLTGSPRRMTRNPPAGGCAGPAGGVAFGSMRPVSSPSRPAAVAHPGPGPVPAPDGSGVRFADGTVTSPAALALAAVNLAA